MQEEYLQHQTWSCWATDQADVFEVLGEKTGC